MHFSHPIVFLCYLFYCRLYDTCQSSLRDRRCSWLFFYHPLEPNTRRKDVSAAVFSFFFIPDQFGERHKGPETKLDVTVIPTPGSLSSHTSFSHNSTLKDD